MLKDPDVASLSSFIGVDGTNTTPNSGRVQINLKPKDERSEDVSAIIKRLQQETAGVEGITLYMQPVQDLTVEDRISRTQYQFSLEDADPNELQLWTGRLMAKLKTIPELRDVATDQQNQAAVVNVVIDRDTASRLGVTASAVDNTLYDAFGQRLVSIMFTQLNQYHVVLEVARVPGRSRFAQEYLVPDVALKEVSLIVRWNQRAGSAQRHRALRNRRQVRWPSTTRDSFRR